MNAKGMVVAALAGAVVVLTVSSARAGAWSQEAKLMASDGATGDFFGCSVSISGDYAIAGAPGNNDSGLDSGSAYLFERGAGGAWNEVGKLTASDGTERDAFGCSVSLSGDCAIVGAHNDDGSDTSSGSAYVFRRGADGTWSEEAKLIASDTAAYDYFGGSISLSGDRAIIGARADDDHGLSSGSAYIFERGADGMWYEAAKLTASDGATGQEFGRAVSVSGDYAIVGTWADDEGGEDSGAAYIFERGAGGAWSQVAKLKGSDTQEYDYFGYSVGISGAWAIVGAELDDDNGINSGSAFVFQRGPDGVWSQAAKLTASDGQIADLLGCSVSLSGNQAIVAAYNDTHHGWLKAGSAYIFERGADGTWSEEAKLMASDGGAEDLFGWSVSLSGGCAIVGARFDDDSGDMSGSAYIYTPEPGTLTLLILGGAVCVLRRRK